MDIPALIEEVISHFAIEEAQSIEQLVAVDVAARHNARLWLTQQKIAVSC
jgi:1-deoxy-D-xylulose 5-phosphate reductoisomerase